MISLTNLITFTPGYRLDIPLSGQLERQTAVIASGIWIALAAIAGFVGFMFAYLDWSSKGKI